MAIFSFGCQVVQCSKGESVVKVAARCSATQLYDQRLDRIFNYHQKKPVVFSRLLLPEGIGERWQDRAFFWNAIEAHEKRKDAQVARLIRMALPVELTVTQQSELILEYATTHFLKAGMGVDINVLDFADNPTAYCLLTMRVLGREGFGERKILAWNTKKQLFAWREGWAMVVNQALAAAGFEVRVDHRSLSAQGQSDMPQIRMGAAAFHAAQRGVHLERWVLNEAIKSANQGHVAPMEDDVE